MTQAEKPGSGHLERKGSSHSSGWLPSFNTLDPAWTSVDTRSPVNKDEAHGLSKVEVHLEEVELAYTSNHQSPARADPEQHKKETISNDDFTQAISHLRAKYQKVRDRTRLTSPAGRPVIELSIEVVDNIVHHTYWYEDGSPQNQCIRLADIPGTLSGDILRLRRDLPILDGDHEIIGDQIRCLEDAPKLPPPFDDTSGDLTAILASLPVIDIDPDRHFIKKGKHESEIRNLLKCQGGSCPGVPISPHIIQLLERSSNGELVFEKFKSRYVLAYIRSLAIYKSWILQLISGLQALHSLGIVHRDLRVDNLLFSSEDTKIIICDL